MDAHDDDGNVEQTRIIAKAIARQMIEVYGEPASKEIPAPLKWGAGVVAGLMTVGAAGLMFWMVSTVSDTQIIVTEIRTRQEMTAQQWDSKFEALEARMIVIEQQSRLNAAGRMP